MAAAAAASSARVVGQGAPPRVALTFDDFNIHEFAGLPGAVRNRAILAALHARSLKAGVFVVGRHVENAATWRLLQSWNDAGHLVGNHSYSHPRYSRTPFSQFAQDVRRSEALLQRLSQFRKWFRFPYLDEGATTEQRDTMRAFLSEAGYRNAHVTIDTSDWYIDVRLRARLAKQPDADISGYRTFYLDHIWERALFYDGLSRQVLGRSPSHILLLHHNVLNGTFLADLLDLFDRKGWQVIDPRDAYEDPLFRAVPNVVPAGQSLVWSLAKETGRFDEVLRYPGEDGVYEAAKMDAVGL